jgi:predicted membrane GTPase involved in stress response
MLRSTSSTPLVTPIFGGEVERVLKMADGVLLLCDACEGAMPSNPFRNPKGFGFRLKTNCGCKQG